MKKLQKGFSIVSAIFLLVVLSFLGTAMVTLSASQNQSSAMDVMGSRAYQAARAGVEWGALQVLQNSGVGFAPACRAAPASAILPAGTLAGTLNGFVVQVDCFSTVASEATAATGTLNVYDLTSTATQGVVGTSDYFVRRIQVSIAQ
jgi:MSHA biogenesis protein MshP